ncbi:DUF2971 domain-containing protein [Pseudomonas sp. DCB_BG]|uniref:DUF2971 domain-containing protein n=1 Tax=Pseudomonas sp. DCB_BG TaxID=2993595 RepID=UPI0022498174|nr:DUF2971 domain-containing protein [Pseudomonas sp. DCB_BG]MCX2709045.1 DUF2971 domain-containing protein [Pseudomonas sp. DCB_BG]
MLLFKYLKPERIDVLLNKCLVFSKPARFNDPFDCLPHYQSSDELNPLGARIYHLCARPEELHLPRCREEILDHVRRSFAADPSFTLQAVVLVDSVLPENYGDMAGSFRASLAPGLQNAVVALSLSENASSLLMWAHYAGDHTGFVIGFDSEHRYFRAAGTNPSNPGYLNKVVYSDERPSGVAGAMSAEAAYLTKGLDWSYEKEWRILQSVKNASVVKGVPGFEVHLFDYPSDAVSKIIVGARASAETKESIKELLSDKKVWPNATLYHALVDERHYRLNYDRIEI